MKPLVIALLLCALSEAAVVARWEAGRGAAGIELVRGPESPWKLEASLHGPVAALEPSCDYYRGAAFHLKLPEALAEPLWLSVQYVDEGYGLITVEPGTAQARQWGVARLATGRLRRAVFGYGAGELGGRLRLYGVTRLRALALSDAEPEREPIPDVQPAVRLKRPVQLVTTAGADARTPEGLEEALATMRNLLPLVRALGFGGIESYVKWNFVERSPGVFDWSFHDAVNDELDRHGLRWFPLLIVGSAYTLPAWFHDSEENAGFECLEHRMRNDIQSIFCGLQDRYVERFLAEFGRHYGRRKTLLGVRLGPSGNYGEAPYPARGDWGYQWGPIHTHIGYWPPTPAPSAVSVSGSGSAIARSERSITPGASATARSRESPPSCRPQRLRGASASTLPTGTWTR